MHFKPRPARRHNKTVLVERKNRIIKTILNKLTPDPSKCPLPKPVSRATFLSNSLSGNSILSSFELVHGYQPAILGMPRSIYLPSILEAYKKLTFTRALKTNLRSRNVNSPIPTMFKQNGPIWVWYASTKSNERNECVRAQVPKPHQHYIEARRVSQDEKVSKGIAMTPAFEDVRLAPQGDLTENVLSSILEKQLSDSHEKSTDEGENDDISMGIHPQISSALISWKGPKDGIGTYANTTNFSAPP